MSEDASEAEMELLAAEWAFGLLDPSERREADARRERDQAFDRACQRWRDRAAALLDGPDLAPTPALWERLSARLPANDAGEAVMLRRSVRRWRGVAGCLGAIVLALASVITTERWTATPHPAQPPVIAEAAPIVVILTSEDRHAILSLSVDRRTGRYAIANDAFKAGAHTAQLWVIPDDGVPRSLGLLPDHAKGSRIGPLVDVGRVKPGVTLAVSLEPLGGSPTGLPTGPVVLKGRA